MSAEERDLARRPGRFVFVIDNTNYDSTDSQIDAEEALTLAGHDPADQFVLIEIKDRGTVSIGLDEKIDLRDGVRTFRSFRTDRIFRFTVEGHGYEWGANAIGEPELRAIARVPEESVLSLDLQDSPDAIIADGSDIQLGPPESERINVRPRPNVVIKVNTRPVMIPRGWHTGTDIKAAAIAQGVQIKPDFTLDQERAGGDFVSIGDSDRIFIVGGEVFGAVDNHEDS